MRCERALTQAIAWVEIEFAGGILQ